MTTTRTRGTRAALAAAGLLAMAGLLAGCGSSGDAYGDDAYADATAPMAEEAMPDMMIDGEMAAEAPRMDSGAGSSSAVETQRQVIRTAYVSMRVESVPQSAVEVRGLANGFGGIVTDESLTADGSGADDITNSYATVTVQVPADRLEEFLTAVSDLGTVDSRTVSAQDVTLQVVDLDARIDALTTSITRLQELLARAGSVEDLLAVETELSRRQADLDALQAQRTYLGEQVAMSTVTVSLSPMTYVTSSGAPGFLSGLESGWSALVAAGGALITLAGFLLPFLVILAIVAVPVTILIVRLARRGRRVHEWASDSGNGSGTAVTTAPDNAVADGESSPPGSSPSS